MCLLFRVEQGWGWDYCKQLNKEAGFVVYGWVKETGLADLQEQSDPVGEQSSCHNLGGDTVDISAHAFNIHT